MANILGGITGFFDKYVLGFALGTAAGPSLEPFVQDLANAGWAANPVMPPEAVLLAEGVAQGQVDPKQAAIWAKQHGFDQVAFTSMVNIANVGPGSGYAFELWRRGLIDEAGFRRAVKRLGWEQEWIDAAVQLKTVRLSAELVAVMLQRSVIPNQGQLPGIRRAAAGKVPRFPEVPINAYASALAHGFDNDQLDALARIQGLPPGMDLVARMVFRKILDRSDFTLAAEQANRRVEWADFEFDGYRQIPTAEQFVEGHLRGWITKQAMYDGTALHGMSQPNTDLEFQIHRRPMTVRQITQALAWGGNFNPEAGEIQDPYDASVHQLNLGPEWYGLAKALKHTYSVPFWWRSMTQTGDLGPQEAETILLRLGNPPAFAKTTTQHFAGGTAAAADPHVTKAHNTAWTKAQTSYIARESTAADVQPIFTLLGIPASAQTEITQTWNAIRALVRAQLTPTQIKKALREGITNPATGAAWTMQEAIDALLARGYDQADATVLLEE